MEVDQLRYFLKVAERGNFTRAAEELLVSQPALSRSIQKLEAELGRPVFERGPRRVTLTDAGRLLHARTERALTILEDVKAEIADDGESGTVRVGAIPTIAPYYLPEILHRFSEAFPRTTVLVQENTTDRILKSCSLGEIDLAIVALPVPGKYLQVDVLFEEELLLVLPPNHPLLAKASIRVSDVEPYPFVLLDEAHCLSGNIGSICRQRSFQPVVVERTSQLVMVQELVALSHGISMVPSMARRLDHSERRVYRSFTRPRAMRTIAMATNPHRFHSRVTQSFMAYLQASLPA